MANWQEFRNLSGKAIALNLDRAICVQPGTNKDTTDIVFQTRINDLKPGQIITVSQGIDQVLTLVFSEVEGRDG